jgi:ATP-dependent Zn protease
MKTWSTVKKLFIIIFFDKIPFRDLINLIDQDSDPLANQKEIVSAYKVVKLNEQNKKKQNQYANRNPKNDMNTDYDDNENDYNYKGNIQNSEIINRSTQFEIFPFNLLMPRLLQVQTIAEARSRRPKSHISINHPQSQELMPTVSHT